MKEEKEVKCGYEKKCGQNDLLGQKSIESLKKYGLIECGESNSSLFQPLFAYKTLGLRLLLHNFTHLFIKFMLFIQFRE